MDEPELNKTSNKLWHFSCTTHGPVDYPVMVRGSMGTIDWKCDKCGENVKPVYEEITDGDR